MLQCIEIIRYCCDCNQCGYVDGIFSVGCMTQTETSLICQTSMADNFVLFPRSNKLNRVSITNQFKTACSLKI